VDVAEGVSVGVGSCDAEREGVGVGVADRVLVTADDADRADEGDPLPVTEGRAVADPVTVGELVLVTVGVLE
jgi:hypothetical protein